MPDSTRRRRFRHEHEEGQVLPALLVLVVAMLLLGMALFNEGRASTIRGQSQTAADAAALAGAGEVKRQVLSSLAAIGPMPREQIGPDLVVGVLDQGRTLSRQMEAAESDYAGRNRARLVAADRPSPLDAWVEVETEDTLNGAGPVRAMKGRRSRARAQARVLVTFLSLPSVARLDPLDYIRLDVRLASGA